MKKLMLIAACGLSWTLAAEPARLGEAEISFALAMGTSAEKKPSLWVRAEQMRAVTVSETADGCRTIVWRGHPQCGEDFRVTAHFRPRKEGGWTYGFTYDGNAAPLDVEQICFPRLTVPRTDETSIFYPHEIGWLRKVNWADKKPGAIVGRTGPRCVGLHFAMVLGEDGRPGWYFDMRGAARLWPTSFAFYKGRAANTVVFEGACSMPAVASSRAAGALPYEGVITPLTGGWFAGAAIYRAWAKTQPFWGEAAALRARGVRSDRVSLWLWNRGRTAVATEAIENLQRDTGVPLGLFWYWWHRNPYGGEGPYYWPPRDPLEVFKSGVADLRAKGVYVSPYVNGIACDADDPRWTEADWGETIVNRDGSYYIRTYNPWLHHRSAHMCGSAEVFGNRLASLCGNLAAAGVDAVYIDQIAHYMTQECWAEGHGHPRGGGTHNVEGYRRLVRRIRAENPGVEFSSEEPTEAFLGLFESLICQDTGWERSGLVAPEHEFVPAYQAVYHPVIATYGAYATVDNFPPWDEKWPAEEKRNELANTERDFADQFAVELVRPVVYGMQPQVHKLLKKHTTEARYAANYRFLVETAKFFHANRPFLLEGEMLDPGRMTCRHAPVKFLRCGTYTKKGTYPVVVNPDVPTVYASAWQARDGRKAAVLGNWTTTAQRYRLETPDFGVLEGELPARSWICRQKESPARR